MTRRALAGALVALICGPAASPAGPASLTLGVAASLRTVMPKLVGAYRERRDGGEIVASYGASGDLERQVESGAPIDAVVFAAPGPVDRLIAAGRAEAASRRRIATNVLVLVGGRRTPPLGFTTIERLPANELLAIGEPGAVPAGAYAKQALERLGKWSALQGRLVFAGNVAEVLTYVRRGEAAAGIVYETDARGAAEVVLLDRANGPWAPTPEVVAAVTDGGKARERAREFVAFLGSPEAQAILRGFGFGPP